MTLTFNADKYTELLQKYQPKIIRSEQENEQALTIIEKLIHKKNRTPEEDEIYDLLVTLVEKFEQENYAPGAASTPHSLLTFLMEQKGIKQTDLVGIIGSREVVSEIINGKQNITESQARALGEFFQVEPSLFI